MKPLTRIAAWVWIGLAAWGVGMAVESQRWMASDAPAWLHSVAWLLVGVALSLGFLLGGFGLARGKSWGWWVVVAGSAVGLFGWLSSVDYASAARHTTWPAWMLWTTTAWSWLRLPTLAALVLDPPWRWTGPEGAGHELKPGHLRPPTAAIAWNWLVVGALWVLIPVSGIFWPGRQAAFSTERLVSTAGWVAFGLFLVLAALALLKRRPWGWKALTVTSTVLVVLGAMGLAGALFDRLMRGPASDAARHGPHPAEMVAFVLLAVLSRWGLRNDPPSRWREAGESPAPDTGETPVPPGPDSGDSPVPPD
jgi:hypothetical protein